MDPLSVTASVIALVQAVKGATKAVKYITSLGNASEEYYRLQNELQLVEGYLYCLNPILEAYKQQCKPFAELNIAHLEASISDIEQEMRDLDDFLKKFTPRYSDSASRKVTRTISWRNHKHQLTQRCDSLYAKKMNLAHAVGLLQSSIGLSQSSMLLLMRDETKSVSEQIGGQIYGSTNEHDTEESQSNKMRLAERIVVEPADGTTAGADESPAPHDSKCTVNILTTLAFGCRSTCRCQCHKVSTLSSPKFLTTVIGRILVTTTGMPVQLRKACSHPTCSASAGSVRVSLVFPSWIVKRAVFAKLTWDSGLNAGASLHLKVRRMIPWPHEAWVSIKNHDLGHLQRLLSQKIIHPTDIDDSGFGQGFLQYALRMAKKISSYQAAIWDIIALLMELDPEVCREDYIGRSPMAELTLMLSLPNRSPSLDGLAQKAISLAGNEYHDHNTPVHDVLLGRSKLSLEEALSIEPKSVDALDVAGLSPLHWAVHHGDVAAVQILLSWKASVDLLSRGEQRTPLHIAARGGYFVCAKTLLDAGADVNYRDVYHRTALCLAALSGAADLVALLLSRGADVHAQEVDRKTVLHRAIEPDTKPKDAATLHSVIGQLVQYGIDLDYPDASGETPIMKAIKHNCPAAFQALVSVGAQLVEKDSNGRTIFHYAASYANLMMIQALEKADLSKVDPDAHDKTGQTALAILEKKVEEGKEDVDIGTTLYAFQNMMTAAKWRYSQHLNRETTQQYYGAEEGGTETYEDAVEDFSNSDTDSKG